MPAFVVPGSNGNGYQTPPEQVRRALARPLPATTSGATPEDLLHGFMLAIARAVSETTSETSATLWLTIDQAAAVSGLSRAFLLRKCQSGWTGAIKDRAWKIRRKDLEAL